MLLGLFKGTFPSALVYTARNIVYFRPRNSLMLADTKENVTIIDKHQHMHLTFNSILI